MNNLAASRAKNKISMPIEIEDENESLVHFTILSITSTSQNTGLMLR